LFGKAQPVVVTFDERVDGSDLSAAAQSCLYRIVQESVRNAAKHGRATKVRVELRKTAEAPPARR